MEALTQSAHGTKKDGRHESELYHCTSVGNTLGLGSVLKNTDGQPMSVVGRKGCDSSQRSSVVWRGAGGRG